MGKNKPIIGFILGIIVAVVIFFANIPGLERTGQMCMAFSLMLSLIHISEPTRH